MSRLNGHPVTRKELREELKRYATQESVSRLVRSVGDLSARVSSIEEKMLTREDFDRILKVLDGLATSSRQAWAKLVVHEQRIKALEER